VSDQTPPEAVLVVCALCRETAVGLPDTAGLSALYPEMAEDIVERARIFRQGKIILVHHGCTSAQADTEDRYWVQGRDWWACKEPARDLDEFVSFDLSCDQCARRWLATRNTYS
jgi:hypothetical protein